MYYSSLPILPLYSPPMLAHTMHSVMTGEWMGRGDARRREGSGKDRWHKGEQSTLPAPSQDPESWPASPAFRSKSPKHHLVFASQKCTFDFRNCSVPGLFSELQPVINFHTDKFYW